MRGVLWGPHAVKDGAAELDGMAAGATFGPADGGVGDGWGVAIAAATCTFVPHEHVTVLPVAAAGAVNFFPQHRQENEMFGTGAIPCS
jgi:hypothetical protein